MAASDARPFPLKGVAYRVTFPIFNATGDLVTGAAGLDSEVSKDGGTFADCTNEATEIATSSGMYYLDLTATELNADTVAIIVKTSTSGAKTTPIVLYPVEAGDISVNVEQISGDATAADNLEAACDGTGYNVGGGSVVAASVSGNVGGNVTGSVGSVTGSVGSVTGNVGGNVVGSVGSVASGGITAASIATNAIDADAIAADAVTEIQSGLATAAALATVAGYVDTEVAAILAAVDTEVGAIKAKTDYLPSATAGAAGGVFIAGSNAATTVNLTGNLSGSVGSVTGNVGGNVSGSVGSVAAGVTVADKTGFKLASDGLDSISTTAPAGVAGNFREMVVALWRRHFKKVTMTSTQLKTYAEDGTTVMTTQSVADDGTTQTQGAAT